jgi:hypothetical protein
MGFRGNRWDLVANGGIPRVSDANNCPRSLPVPPPEACG